MLFRSLNNYSDEKLAEFGIYRDLIGGSAGGGTTVSGDGSAGGSIVTSEGEGSQATGDGGMNLNVNSELELGDEVTLEGNIEGNEGHVNMGSGNQFGLDYDYNNEEDNRDQSVELHYSDDDLTQTVTSSYDIENSGANSYINAPTMTFASGGGGALDNIQGVAAYGELLKGGRKHYGAAHADAAKSAIDNSPINQRKLGEAKGAISNFFDFKTKMAKYNALGKAGLGLGSFNWSSNPDAYNSELPDLTA